MPEPIGREVGPGHRVVSSAMLPEQLVECPHCGGKNFSLVGDFHRTFEQVFEEGQPIKNGMSLGANAVQNVEGLVCKGCNVHTIIEDEEVFERESLIFDLHTQIVTLQGKVATPPVKEWKQ